MRSFLVILLVGFAPALAGANPPVASYIFPAGGQRGTTVPVRVGGLFLQRSCGFEMLGAGIRFPARLQRTRTLWFEGPLLPLPDSQRQEDYPQDMAGALQLAADAAPGLRYWRLWTAQGATPAMKFVVGELPEFVEDEIDGDPIPVQVALPVTINGRIFPREDIDIWTFPAKKGQTIRCEVHAARLGSPLDARLEVHDPQGRRIAENDDQAGADPMLIFTAPADGVYQVHIQDARAQGGQAYVYRLTLTAEPYIDHVYPLGGRRGSTLELAVAGQNVPVKLTASLPKEASPDHVQVFTVGEKKTNPVLLDVDDLPEFLAEADRARVIALPAVLNGQIAKRGQVDTWRWQGRKDESWEFQLRAAQLGSRLDGILTIQGPEGKELLRAEANPLDPVIAFKVPADGVYSLQVQDRFRSRGGAPFAYRVRIAAAPAADFRLWLGADAVTLLRKGTAKLKVQADRIGGFKEPIALEVRGLPERVTVAGTVLAPGLSSVELTFKTEESIKGAPSEPARIGTSRLTIVGKARSGTKEIERQARMPVDRGAPELSSVLLAVALPTPFVIKGEYDMSFAARGGMHRRHYKIERNGYDGPIEVCLTDRQARHLQGVTGPTIVVPAGATEFTYAAYLPPWMETGRTCRVCVMGVGKIKEPDGSMHEVSFSSVNQNEQLVAVVGPGKLALDAEQTSYVAKAGQSFTVNVHIKRGQDIEGPVELELVLPAHLHGLRAERTTIAAKEERGQLIVQCDEKRMGPFNMPLVLRATLMRNGEPIVDEGKLDVQP